MQDLLGIELGQVESADTAYRASISGVVVVGVARCVIPLEESLSSAGLPSALAAVVARVARVVAAGGRETRLFVAADSRTRCVSEGPVDADGGLRDPLSTSVAVLQ
jgi:hypothetical protein